MHSGLIVLATKRYQEHCTDNPSPERVRKLYGAMQTGYLYRWYEFLAANREATKGE